MRLGTLVVVITLFAAPALALPAAVREPAHPVWTQQVVGDPRTGLFDFATASDASAYFAYRAELPNDGIVLASRTAGRWVETPAAPGVDARLVFDPDDNPHIFYTPYSFVGISHAYQNGASWVSEPIETVNSVGRYEAVADAQGRLHIAYDGTFGIRYGVKPPGGAWTIESVTTERPFGVALALDPNGEPRIAYNPINPNTGVLRYAAKTGTTWTTVTIPATGFGPDLAIDPSGSVHVAFETAASTAGYAKLENNAWHVETVDSAAPTGRDGSIGVDDSGKVHMAYHDRYNPDSPLGGKTRYATQLDEGTWLRQGVSHGYTGRGKLIVDPDGFPRVGYYLYSTQGVETTVARIMLAEPIQRTLIPHVAIG